MAIVYRFPGIRSDVPTMAARIPAEVKDMAFSPVHDGYTMGIDNGGHGKGIVHGISGYCGDF